MAESLQLLSGSWPDEPGLDTAISKLILEGVSTREMPAALRLYIPGREVAFGKRDTVTPQYPQAVAAASAAGFLSVQRLAGGRAAVFTEHTVAFALVVPVDDPRTTIYDRFGEISSLIVATFARLGIASAVGEIAGEYCPGDFSVHHDGRIKLMGVGQRLAKNAAHIGGVVTVARTDLLLRALIPVYRALEIEWRPHTAGTLADVQPGIDVDSTIAALTEEFGERYDLVRGGFDPDLVAAARDLAHSYLPSVDS